MNITINIFQTTKEKINPEIIKKIIHRYLADKKTRDIITLDVLITGKDKIRYLNKKYRKIDQATDVLSFPVVSPAHEKLEIYNLGSLVVCPEIVRKNAQIHQTSVETELEKVIIHSLDHLWNQA